MKHTDIDTIPYRVGDTVKFSDTHVLAGDTAVIVAYEGADDQGSCYAWNGVGTPERDTWDFNGRYLLHLCEKAPDNPHMNSFEKAHRDEMRAMCGPNYPYCWARDFVLVGRTQTWDDDEATAYDPSYFDRLYEVNEFAWRAAGTIPEASLKLAQVKIDYYAALPKP